MKHNIGKIEKIIRIVIGLITIYLAWEISQLFRIPLLVIPLLVIPLYFFITAAIRFCPITNFWDIDTSKWGVDISRKKILNSRVVRILALLTLMTATMIGFMWVIEGLIGIRTRQLTRPEMRATSPTWSPDGERTVFVSVVDPLHTIAIWTMDSDGRNLRQLVEMDRHRAGKDVIRELEDLAWSPDGERIVFVANGAKGDIIRLNVIWIIDSNGRNLKRLVNGSSPVWSPDGERIVFRKDRALWIIDRDGENLKQLALVGGLPEHGATLHWSPDGERIAFTFSPAGTSFCYIGIVDSDGENLKQLARGRSPTWSPDGKRIAFARWGGYIWVIDSDGENLRQLMDPDRLRMGWISLALPTWSPDGERIAFITHVGIGVIDSDGKNLRILTMPFKRRVSSPVWSPDSEKIVFSAITITGVRSFREYIGLDERIIWAIDRF